MSGMSSQQYWSETMTPGGKWSGRIGRGRLIRFTALEKGAGVSLLLYNVQDLTERYNMPDTLKAQHTAHLTRGHILMSDNGRAMVSIVRDSLGWHDPIGGYSLRSGTEEKYGLSRYQEVRNNRYRNAQDNFSIELVRSGLAARDLSPSLNLFSKIRCDEEGGMHFAEGHCPANASITLRTEMDILLLASNTPSPLDPSLPYPAVPVQIEILNAEPLEADDECVNSHPENLRAFENTWKYYALQN
ncbi:urea carboxylase-associated family protein [Paenibacillus sp. MMS20-IR301]|nr:urea amidolyase associated protein UAAP1 [Paenibacillus sp. MMS20-IR301]WNS46014.1 urea carboxylase-associated family protein [Paenibacillus sp. MMS20-IR301]